LPFPDVRRNKCRDQCRGDRHPGCPVRGTTVSSAYSMIFARTNGGSRFELNIRQMILAEIPVPLCLVERIVQAVLRGNSNTFACASSETNPAVISASPISRILDACRVFTSVSVRSGVLFRKHPGFSGALPGSRAGRLCNIFLMPILHLRQGGQTPIASPSWHWSTARFSRARFVAHGAFATPKSCRRPLTASSRSRVGSRSPRRARAMIRFATKRAADQIAQAPARVVLHRKRSTRLLPLRARMRRALAVDD
jgi:hypothetical protein